MSCGRTDFSGWKYKQDTPALCFFIKKENIKDGVVIVSIEPNSPLGKVGIKQDAVLLELNGKKIIDKENFRNITKGVKHGDKYTIKYHQNGTTKKDKIII